MGAMTVLFLASAAAVLGMAYSLTPNIDVELFEMSIFITGNNILPKTPLKGEISFSFNTRIVGAGLTIPQATGDNKNFDVEFTFSSSESATGSPAVIATNDLVLQASDVKASLSSGSSHAFEGSASLGLPAAICNSAKVICATVKPTGTTPTYSDQVLSNNKRCKNVAVNINCGPDLLVPSFTTVPTLLEGLVGAANMGFSLTLKNNAPVGDGNRIRVATGTSKNFALIGYYGKADALETGDNKVGSSFVFADISNAEYQQGIQAQSEIALTGKVTYPAVTYAQCYEIRFACISVHRGEGATYLDSDETDNFKCSSINRICLPDVTITAFSLVDKGTGLIFPKEPAKRKFGVALTIKNVDTVTDIPANSDSSKTNFKLTLYFSATDATNQGTAGLTGPIHVPISSKNSKLDKGGVDQIQVSIEDEFGIKPAAPACENINFMCAHVGPTGTPPPYTEDGTKVNNNIKCTRVVTNCDPDIELKSFSFNQPLPIIPKPKEGPATINFQMTIKNNDATKNLATASQGKNFHIKLYFSTQDSIAGLINPIEKANEFGVTITSGGSGPFATAGLTAGAEITVSGQASLSIENIVCTTVTHLCAHIGPSGSPAPYTDFFETNNHKCNDISSKTNCDPDIVVTAFTGVPGNPALDAMASSSGSFTVQLLNAISKANGNNIRQNTNANFQIVGYFATSATASTPGTRIGAPVVMTTADTFLKQGIIGGASEVSPAGTMAFPALNIAQCDAVTHLCVYVSAAGQASYIDTDLSNNFKCERLNRVCRPDVRVSDLSLTGATYYPRKSDKEVTASFSITVHNDDRITPIASAAGNFHVKFYKSATNVAPTQTVLANRSWRPLTVKSESRGLGANSQATITGSALVSIGNNDIDCQTVNFICAYVSPLGAPLPYVDRNLANNFFCLDVQTKVNCDPDLALVSFSPMSQPYYATNSRFYPSTIVVKNIATNSKNGDQISPNRGGRDTRLEYFFQDSSGNEVADYRKGYDTDLTVPADGSDVTVNRDIHLPNVRLHDCQYIAKLCIQFKPKTYFERVLDNNVKCYSLTRTCNPDIHALALEIPGDVVFQRQSFNFRFGIPIKNEDSTQYIRTSELLKKNFDVDLYLSPVDLEAVGGIENTNLVGKLTRLTDTSNFVLDGNDGFKMNGIQTMMETTIRGTGKFGLDSETKQSCADLAYLCAFLFVAGTSPFTDPDFKNNWACKNIAAQVSCNPNFQVKSFGPVPSANDPFIATRGRTSNKFTLEIMNAAPIGDGNGIVKVTGDRVNFKVIGYYGNGLATDVTSAVGLYRLNVTFPVIELQYGIEPQETVVLKGTVDFTPVDENHCADVNHVCIKIVEGKGATFIDTVPEDNFKCLPIVRTCRPDPRPENLQMSVPVRVDQATKIQFSVDVKNHAPLGQGNDLPSVTDLTYHYRVALQFSNENMAYRYDTLRLERMTTYYTAAQFSKLQQPLRAGGSASVTISGEAWATLPKDGCSVVKYLCAILSASPTQDYIDESAAAQPHDIRIKTTCIVLPVETTSCHPDPSITSFELDAATGDPAPYIFVEDEWRNFKVKKLEIQNVAKGPHSIIHDVAAPNQNFFIQFKLTNADLRYEKSTINSTEFVYDLTGATANDKFEKGLAPEAKMTFTGSLKLVLTEKICHDIKYICAIFRHGRSYRDEDTSNDAKCIDITRKKTCKPDILLQNLFILNAKILVEDTEADVIFGLSITNVAPGRSGNDILPIATSPSGSAFHFKVITMLSKVNLDWNAPRTTYGIENVTVSVQITLPLQTLGQSLPFVSTVKRTIRRADCAAVKYFCVIVVEGDNAQYKDANITNNIKCVNIEERTGSLWKNCLPSFTSLPASVPLGENKPTGTKILDAAAQHNDGAPQASMTYTLGNYVNIFQIDASSGAITTKRSLDYETDPKSFKLQVIAADTTTAAEALKTTATLTILIQDVNEAPTFDPATPVTAQSVSENAETSVYSMSYSDPDRPPQSMTYSLDIVPSLTPAAPFWIDSSGQISLSSPGLNYEQTSKYTLSVHMTDGGTPTLSATPAIIVVPCAHVPEQPRFKNLPAAVVLDEQGNGVQDGAFFTLEAEDPDAGASLTYHVTVTPNDGNIILSGSDIKYKGNPTFDHERTKEYDVTVMVRDGVTDHVTSSLVVKVINSTRGDLPIFDESDWPTNVVISESLKDEADIYTVKASDPDNRPVAFSMTVNPPSGQGKFVIDPKHGRLQTVKRPMFDFESEPRYIATITVCAFANCTSKDIIINIKNVEEPPLCEPAFMEVTTDETDNWTPTRLFRASDPDGSPLQYSKVSQRRFSSNFNIGSSSGLISATGLDFDQLPSRIETDFQAMDAAGSTCAFHLVLHISDRNVAPVFNPSAYSGAILESAETGTSILEVTATDGDIGDNGRLKFYVDEGSGRFAKNHFELKQKTASKAILVIKSSVDRDIMGSDVITFNVIVEDLGGMSASASVRVLVKNVNDNRPAFEKDLYSLEVLYDAPVGTSIGEVMCTDKDVADKTLTYSLLSDDESDHIFVHPNTGLLTLSTTPLKPDRSYVMYAVCTDDGPGRRMASLTQPIRVDTYVGWRHLTNWTTALEFMFYTKRKVKEFLDGASLLCSCSARLHSIQKGPNGTILTLYFLEDSSTEAVGSIGKTKIFLEATYIVKRFTTDNLKTPTEDVKNSLAFALDRVQAITRYGRVPLSYNWFLDTLEGQVVLGTIAMAALVICLVVAVCVSKFVSKNSRSTRETVIQETELVEKKDTMSPQPSTSNKNISGTFKQEQPHVLPDEETSRPPTAEELYGPDKKANMSQVPPERRNRSPTDRDLSAEPKAKGKTPLNGNGVAKGQK